MSAILVSFLAVWGGFKTRPYGVALSGAMLLPFCLQQVQSLVPE